MEDDLGRDYGPLGPDMTPQEERRYLEGYLKDIEAEAADVKKRLEELNKKGKK